MSETAKIKGSSETVKVTGKSGDWFRIWHLSNGNYSHEWLHKDDLTFEKGSDDGR